MSTKKYLIAGFASGILLTGCWGNQSSSNLTPTPTMGITPQQMESLKTELQTKTGSTLITPATVAPENIKEINLTPQAGITASGIAVITKLENNQTNYQVLADLPELKADERYWAWLTDGSTYKRLGQVKASKAGFIFEIKNNENLENLKTLNISKETTNVDKPTSLILQGEFK